MTGGQVDITAVGLVTVGQVVFGHVHACCFEGAVRCVVALVDELVEVVGVVVAVEVLDIVGGLVSGDGIICLIVVGDFVGGGGVASVVETVVVGVVDEASDG